MTLDILIVLCALNSEVKCDHIRVATEYVESEVMACVMGAMNISVLEMNRHPGTHIQSFECVPHDKQEG